MSREGLSMIDKERIRLLHDVPSAKGRYVLYWMQQSQRADFNHAFEFAIDRANRLGRPLVVFFGITPRFPRANANHYRFMLQGLAETAGAVEGRGASFLVKMVSPEVGASALAKEACEMVCDRGYLRIQRQWRRRLAHSLRCPLYEVETDVVVPVESAIEKQAYSAAVLRPRVGKLLNRYMKPVKRGRVKARRIRLDADEVELNDPDALLRRLKVSKGLHLIGGAKGGEREARRLLKLFIRERLASYEDDRNDPNLDGTSRLSPYLHFGQISALEVALEVSKSKAKGKAAFLEELVVRRELAMNFAHYNAEYDSYDGIPGWARKTLESHGKDKREYLYTEGELERAETHDPYWNAAQREMMLTGRMHGYMRMYWGKKVIEWSRSPRDAFDILVTLNDRYEMDGRDANGYAGISWCFGTHDRPWTGRKVFGNVRYMNAAGLKRKFDADGYVKRVAALEEGIKPR